MKCTFRNERCALACAMCKAELRDPTAVHCPRCSYEQPAGCARCEMCNEQLEQTWSCSLCNSTEDAVWLECGHKACLQCHASWIDACDQEGLRPEPTCLVCEADRLEFPLTRLSDASIRAILGAERYDKRMKYLAVATGLAHKDLLRYCPEMRTISIDVDTGEETKERCNEMFELEENLQERITTCPRCNKKVTLKPPTPPPTASMAGPSAASMAAEHAIIIDGQDEAAAADGEDTRANSRAQVEALYRDLRSCPKCGITISKTAQSCNKFQCRCGHRFCWSCGVEPDDAGNLPCNCAKTGDEHAFFEENEWYRPRPRKRPRGGV